MIPFPKLKSDFLGLKKLKIETWNDETKFLFCVTAEVHYPTMNQPCLEYKC